MPPKKRRAPDSGGSDQPSAPEPATPEEVVLLLEKALTLSDPAGHDERQVLREEAGELQFEYHSYATFISRGPVRCPPGAMKSIAQRTSAAPAPVARMNLDDSGSSSGSESVDSTDAASFAPSDALYGPVADSFTRTTTYSAVRLLDLSALVATQLPNMECQYIAKTVFDPHHIAICAVSIPSALSAAHDTDGGLRKATVEAQRSSAPNGVVVGGCVFRPFPKQGFIELVFLAVDGEVRARGLGVRIILHLKELMRRCGIYHVITYADDGATDFFKKQGFSMEIQCPSGWFAPFIKHYTGATKMECLVHPLIPDKPPGREDEEREVGPAGPIDGLAGGYVALPAIFRAERRTEIQRGVVAGHYQVLDASAVGLPSELHSEAARRVAAAGWQRVLPHPPSEDTDRVAFVREYAAHFVGWLKRHPLSVQFRAPVDSEAHPDYRQRIMYPMDFKTMSDRKNNYTTLAQFEADVHRVHDNCAHYNQDGTPIIAHVGTILSEYHAERDRWLRSQTSHPGHAQAIRSFGVFLEGFPPNGQPPPGCPKSAEIPCAASLAHYAA